MIPNGYGSMRSYSAAWLDFHRDDLDFEGPNDPPDDDTDDQEDDDE